MFGTGADLGSAEGGFVMCKRVYVYIAQAKFWKPHPLLLTRPTSKCSLRTSLRHNRLKVWLAKSSQSGRTN